ncbi:hypothetical protein TCAL_07308 [Tigriopus californicus]|uniref:NADH dehydrogenase [ubiquinone] 1 beta subcomplex subunit 10 n=1 Tax=Tigriopus californicus TaxID=6832 RepID=A0A553PH04_TIGCA|nr:NADH dehydrogenase [ubiquinone] 1 beta subcomplex subunit 10-like [Tigriopus californicus]TRY76961.1 hypothetical protein TCAL_07308 [Tigriopus californicus]|eukprot:TCALIF_07308-PA protein Name:"Similar to NADH dehydrogenase [ubiquinone] 1 beta subcomplex subunit 10 (Bombyx mori)" AED:0.02 eAED:0.02 QI:279/1/1/1/0.66/0.75/4/190/196
MVSSSSSSSETEGSSLSGTPPKPHPMSTLLGYNPESVLDRVAYRAFSIFLGPAKFIADLTDKPQREQYPWYHRRFQRVPTIDECYTDDNVCRFEANQQFIRDRQVDRAILNILQNRFWNCCSHNMGKEFAAADPRSPCYQLKQDHATATTNYYIKYGDTSVQAKAEDMLMKQKHRMMWERRHGPVGSGKRVVAEQE